MTSSNRANFRFHSGVIRFLDEVRAVGGSYCHFKSNEHVADGMCGDTDLDILAAREHHTTIVAALDVSGFKLFASGAMTRYPAVEDWLGFDPETGRLAHLHVHWQMVAGEPYLKGYRLPWERQILTDRVWNAEHEIYTASPEMELILLLTRAALKLRTRSVIAALFGRSAHGLDLRREYAWLLERVDIARFKELACSILPADITTMMLAVVCEGRLDGRNFLAMSRALLQYLAPWRTYAPSYANLLRWRREVKRRWLLRLWRRVGLLPVARRSPSTGGMIIALIGADGAGKSTQAKSLVKWLSWKIDVSWVYFGSGDGPISWHRRVLLMASRLLQPARGKPNVSVTTPEAVSQKRVAMSRPATGRGPGVYKILYALSLALEKRRSVRNAVRARNRGMVIVCDRFPQNQILGFNDGPLLADYLDRGFPWGSAARLERRLLAVFSAVVPDLLFKLHVSESVAGRRKADTPKAMIQRKIDAVHSLKFGPACEVIELNADRPLEEITLAIRQQVWQSL